MEASRTPLSEAEFEEIMNRNRAISSSAISRAVSDASAGNIRTCTSMCPPPPPFFFFETIIALIYTVVLCSPADYGSAIETLVTAISLIKQSKVSADDRCKVLISSLQDCLHGIESKSYGSASRYCFSCVTPLACWKVFYSICNPLGPNKKKIQP